MRPESELQIGKMKTNFWGWFLLHQAVGTSLFSKKITPNCLFSLGHKVPHNHNVAHPTTGTLPNWHIPQLHIALGENPQTDATASRFDWKYWNIYKRIFVIKISAGLDISSIGLYLCGLSPVQAESGGRGHPNADPWFWPTVNCYNIISRACKGKEKPALIFWRTML